jgi:hypothetical protein
MPTLRRADPETARHYPLPVQGQAHWQHRDGAWRLALPLPELTTGTILVPSLASLPAPARAGYPDVHRHQWTLTAGGASWLLQEVPARAGTSTSRIGDVVSSHIDCYHVHQRLPAPQLEVAVEADQPPERYLICVSSRAVTIAEPTLPTRRAALLRAPGPRSQMTAPEAIASRICSPTCVSMVLGLWDRPHDWLALAEECHDPASGMYGVWPLALAAAARRGCLGGVEVFEHWEEPLAVLERGVPLVTSIRFAAGELPGAPLTETGGHLVVVYDAGPEQVGVCDPAAAEGDVLRAYPADAFSRAWLRHRGAAYILPP